MVALVVGLGNPGTKYLATRHNVGFMVVSALATHFEFPTFVERHDALVSLGNIGRHRVLLMKPSTFMNNSGAAVQSAVRFYKILPENIIVIHDDADLSYLSIKVKCGGSCAGHNGIRSIDETIGHDYWRVRVGIGKADVPDLSAYVLGSFQNPSEVERAIVPIVENFSYLLDKRITEFRNIITCIKRD